MMAYFVVNEGVADYVGALTALTVSGDCFDLFMRSLPIDRRQALQLVTRILPRPEPLMGRSTLWYSYKTVAVMVGMLLGSQPLLLHYRKKEDFLRDSSLYVDKETPDDNLQKLVGKEDSFKSLMERFRCRIIPKIKRIGELESLEKRHLALQEAWRQWESQFLSEALPFGFKDYVMHAPEVTRQANMLRKSWGVTGIVPEARVGVSLNERSVFSRVTLDQQVSINISRKIYALEDIDMLFRELRQDNKFYLVCLSDQRKKSYTFESTFNIVEDSIGRTQLVESSSEKHSLFITECLKDRIDTVPECLSCVEVVVPTFDMCELAWKHKHHSIFWVAEGEPYILRQIRSSGAGMRPFRLPNVLLRLRDIQEVIKFVSTVKPEHRNKICAGIVISPLRLCFVGLDDEYLYTFSGGGDEEDFFSERMQQLGARPLQTQVERGKRDVVNCMLENIILIDMVLTEVTRRNEGGEINRDVV
jgi:hypothetical protein